MSTLSREFNADGQTTAYWCLGDAEAPRQLIWAHGWGQSHAAFSALAETWQSGAYNILIDFPGFGASPRPAEDWGTADYADACAGLLATLPKRQRIWIGHSFGCRVGLQIGARHPDLVDGLFLVAAAGLRPRRSPTTALKVKAKVGLYKTLRALPLGDKEKLRERFGFSPSANLMPGGAPSNFISSPDLPQRQLTTWLRPPIGLALPCRMLAEVRPPARPR